MGGDIAAYCAQRGLNVTLQDRELKFIDPALKRAREGFEKRLKDVGKAAELMTRITADVPGDGVPGADVIIEAIFENVDAKHELFARVEPKMKSSAILASNTSSIMLEQLGVESVTASAFVPGHGTVRCAHGLMPVPVPAVAEMLACTGAPARMLANDTGELTTPTGCAIVCAVADRFVGRDAVDEDVRVARAGYGAGHKTIAGMVNAVRCALLEPLAAGGALAVFVAPVSVIDSSIGVVPLSVAASGACASVPTSDQPVVLVGAR